MEKLKIYTLTDPKTLEVRYVGKTKQTVEERLNDHIFCRNARKSKNIEKDEWINRLLSENLKPIVKQVDCKFVKNPFEEYVLEAEWVNKFTNLFNKDLVYPKNAISKYDVFGNKLATYCNIIDLIKIENLEDYQIHNLLKVLSEERNRLNDFIFRLGSDDKINPIMYKTVNGNARLINLNIKPVYRYDIEGNFIDEFDCARDVKGFAYKNISQVCLGEKKTHKNYRFSFEKVNKLPPLIKKERKQIKTRKISRLDNNGNVVKTYEGVKFIDDMKVDSGLLSKACRVNKKAYGFYWRYEE